MKEFSLRIVAVEVVADIPFPVALGNFLDAFYRGPDAAMLLEEPPPLSDRMPDGDALDAYLAAVAEHLARAYSFETPAWALASSRQLHHPRFGSEAAALRATLLLESPPAFRSRNLFVTANALDRASRHSSQSKSKLAEVA